MSEQAPRDPFESELLDAAKAERPREGAKARALQAALPELRVGIAVEAPIRAPSVLRARVTAVAMTMMVAASFAGLFFKHQSDVAAAAIAAQAVQLAAQTAQTKKLMEELNAQTSSIASLSAAIQNAKDDAARAAARAQLDLATRAAAVMKERLNAPGTLSGAAPRPRAKCDCTPGDPLCSCIP